MTGSTKLMTPSGGGVILKPASSIASDVTVNVPSQNCTLGIQGPAFSAYANTNQSISSVTFTKVVFGSEIFDTNNNFASSTFTPTVAGYYQINAVTRNVVTSGSITNALISIYKNGSLYRRGGENGSTTASSQTVVSDVIYCNGSTDYIEIYAYIQGTTPFLESASGGTIACAFSGCLVRAA